MNNSIARRQFLKQASAAGIGLSLASAAGSLARAADSTNANSKLTFAVIGTNGRGLSHVQSLTDLPGAEVAYICDVDERAIAKGIKETTKRQKTEPKGLRDFRKVLEDKSVDAVTIATPDHWHAPMAILALAAGKHVYVEKPCSHNPNEGELLIQAVKKSGRVLQMGNQRRSFPNLQQTIKAIREGAIGKACFARGWYANNRGPIGQGKSVEVPSWLEYELWQGPAPRRPYRDNILHYNWHWFWNWGTGEALNNGTHEIDVCRWALGVDFPVRVSSNGGRYAYQDDWETPDTQVIGWDFPGDVTIAWEGRSCNGLPSERLSRGSMIYGTEGSALLDGNDCTLYDKKGKVTKAVKGNEEVDATNTVSSTGGNLDRLHMKNFLDAIRGDAKPNSPAEEGHKSVAMLQLGNIAVRTHRALQCNPANGHIENDPEAAKLWRRDYEPGWEPKV